MDIQAFWGIVENARKAAGDDTDGRVAALEAQLQDLSLAEIQQFQNHYDALIARANRWDLWGAAYVMNGGCSDDGFRYFRDWLISEGHDAYERALASPDSLADVAMADYFELELFGYVALEVYEAKGGGELERDFSSEMAEPEGEPWEEDDLPDLFPKLAAIYD